MINIFKQATTNMIDDFRNFLFPPAIIHFFAKKENEKLKIYGYDATMQYKKLILETIDFEGFFNYKGSKYEYKYIIDELDAIIFTILKAE